MKKRVINLDIARTFAILSVVLCHCVESVYYSNINMPLSLWSKIAKFLIFTFGRLGVPIFLFLSGALLLKKHIDTDGDVINFYKKKLLPLVCCYEIWIVIYNLFLYYTKFKYISIKDLILEMLFFKQIPMKHTWYLVMIIGMYISVPFLARIVKSFSIKSLFPSISIVFAISFLLPTFNIVLSILGINLGYLNSQLSLTFAGGVYGLYIVLGYYIYSNIDKIKTKRSYIAIFIVSICLAVLIQYFGYYNTHGLISRYDIWYDSPFILISSIFLFIWFNKINGAHIKHMACLIFKYLSENSLAIFFIHIIVIELIEPYILLCTLFGNLTKVGLLFVFTIFISIFISYCMGKIKFIRSKLFLIKH